MIQIKYTYYNATNDSVYYSYDHIIKKKHMKQEFYEMKTEIVMVSRKYRTVKSNKWLVNKLKLKY